MEQAESPKQSPAETDAASSVGRRPRAAAAEQPAAAAPKAATRSAPRAGETASSPEGSTVVSPIPTVPATHSAHAPQSRSCRRSAVRVVREDGDEREPAAEDGLHDGHRRHRQREERHDRAPRHQALARRPHHGLDRYRFTIAAFISSSGRSLVPRFWHTLPRFAPRAATNATGGAALNRHGCNRRRTSPQAQSVSAPQRLGCRDAPGGLLQWRQKEPGTLRPEARQSVSGGTHPGQLVF